MLELAGIIILGILAQWVAWRFKIPAILPLILIGLFVGPIASEFITSDGRKWIEPVWNGKNGLFPGEGLYYFLSLAISIILFEGGLTLKRSEIRNVGPVITKLITVGAFITFIGSGITAHYLFGLDWRLAFLFAALIIVTGPTVITPILRNIPLKKDVSTVLKWEGILIDPLGALAAVLVFEFISVEGDSGFTKTALIEFFKIILFGVTFGFTFAHALAFAINKKLIPHYLLNVVSLSVVLLVYVESEIFAHESGLLAVVVMGLVLGNSKLENIKELLYFKESLSVLLISILFILLAANINMEDLYLIYNWNTVFLFLIVVLIIRPLSVFASTFGSPLKTKEKVFISWVGPRGIVAAGIASLFGSKLLKQGVAGAEYITPLVFTIVLGTVLLNATTARYFAKWVGVFLKKSEGILIVGASRVARLIGHYLVNNGRHVVLIDSNMNNIAKAKELGLEAIHTNIYSDTLSDNIELNDVGYLMALTANSEINKYAINKYGAQFGENGSFRLISQKEMADDKNNPREGLFSHTDDYVSLSNVTSNYPSVNEIDLENFEHFKRLIDISISNKNIIPLFIKDPNGEYEIIPSHSNEIEAIESGSQLVYLGKPFDVEKV
ncbi:cation:proton antiporter [Mangrovimonas sp. AS39]|uniref:cation:proton antiporter n=1 Tax=Mangrovimonas TaxID=1211036 RepID=UPI0006B44622|nr:MULTISPECIES: cation:proton antiporter [Mangrovimonas]MCF1190387.1 cation:proton antiporter [Mangrovimonas futianensis]MCF1193860.1 cation:proton antiporter [Mangrovimonas futianensis]MCF1420856.1 cation:proton antiporter [Mangrovimonas futianensis]NIK90936.1 cell shape-determining protein [Mangrovimonas sp. CR14]